MLAHVNGVWLKSEERSFTNAEGVPVQYFRASILDEDYNTFDLSCTLEVHEFAQREVPAMTPCDFIVNILRNSSGLRCRIENILVS